LKKAHRIPVRSVTVTLLLLTLAACARTDLPPVDPGGTLQLQQDEKRLWRRSREEQQRIDDSGLLYPDARLSDYINAVARRVAPEYLERNQIRLRVFVIKNPLLNAFAYPNGCVYVHTGILAKMENEAQLAALLSHEITHITHRHAIENFRSVKNATAVMATIQMASAPFGTYGSLVTVLGAVGGMAAVTGYSRELETEADRVGLQQMVSAGYDPREAPKLFEILKKEVEEEEISEPFFFGTHPRLQERIDNYTAALETQYAGKAGYVYAERFIEHAAPLLIVNAAMDLDMGRFKSARACVKRYLQYDPKSAQAYFMLAEICRESQQADDVAAAEEAYRQSLRLDAALAGSYRGLGLIYYKNGRTAEALEQFEYYLELSPDAADRAYIEQYIQRLRAQ
jgi:predicted Zn-dependent protease